MFKFKIPSIIKLLFMMGTLYLSGCVQVNMPQLNSLYDIIHPPIDPLDQHRWELQVGQYKTEVYFIKINDQTIFVNENEDILLLQDKTLVDIKLPSITDVKINIIDKLNTQQNIIRAIGINETLFETQQCERWVTSSATKNNSERDVKHSLNIMKSVLNCKGAISQTHVLTYENNQLQEINQYIPYIDQNIRLKKVSTR